MQTSRVSLTDDVLVLLDGQCDAETQKDVDAAKLRLAMCEGKDNAELWSFIADVVSHANRNGKLRFEWSRHSGPCRICGKGGGYHPYKRSGRYHNKGDTDYKKPILTPSVDLYDSCVTIKNRIGLGCCTKCWGEHKATVAAALADVKAEIPAAITGQEPRYRKLHKYKCTVCDWVGHGGEMGRMLCLMGVGTYPGKCPKCGAENLPLGRNNLEVLNETVVVDSSELERTTKSEAADG